MSSLTFIQFLNENTHTNLVTEFLNQCTHDQQKFYSKRDNCGPACIDMLWWAKNNKHLELRRVEGEFYADSVVYDKADFTTEMKQEFKLSGLDFNDPRDRKQWIEDSKYAEAWTHIPHYWLIDNENNIHDPTGYIQFIKTGLSSDLSPSRYHISEY